MSGLRLRPRRGEAVRIGNCYVWATEVNVVGTAMADRAPPAARAPDHSSWAAGTRAWAHFTADGVRTTIITSAGDVVIWNAGGERILTVEEADKSE